MESKELFDSGILYLYMIVNYFGIGNVLIQLVFGIVMMVGGQIGYVLWSNFYGLVVCDFCDVIINQVMICVEYDFGGIMLCNIVCYIYNIQSYIFMLFDDSQGNVYGIIVINIGVNVMIGGYVWMCGNMCYGYSESIVDQIDLYGKFNIGSIEYSFLFGIEILWEKMCCGVFVLVNGLMILLCCNIMMIVCFYCVSLFNLNFYVLWVNYMSDMLMIVILIVKGVIVIEMQNDVNIKVVYVFDLIMLMLVLILNFGVCYDWFELMMMLLGVIQMWFKCVDNLFNWQVGFVFKLIVEISLYVSYVIVVMLLNSLFGEGCEDNVIIVVVFDFLKL